jgi:hypothetical protein
MNTNTNPHTTTVLGDELELNWSIPLDALIWETNHKLTDLNRRIVRTADNAVTEFRFVRMEVDEDIRGDHPVRDFTRELNEMFTKRNALRESLLALVILREQTSK